MLTHPFKGGVVMDSFFNYKNILHWALIASPIAAFLLVWIALKKLNILYKKPEIKKITKIAVKPTENNGMGGFVLNCYIDFEVNNPTSSENQISASLQKHKSSPFLAKMEQINLKAMGTTVVRLEIDYEKVEKDKEKKLFLTIEDAKRKKHRKKVLLEAYPHEN